jgi:hypothetical protein
MIFLPLRPSYRNFSPGIITFYAEHPKYLINNSLTLTDHNTIFSMMESKRHMVRYHK